MAKSTNPRPGPAPPRHDLDRPAHDPAPVDLGSESVAGEEDPGASIEPPSNPPPKTPSPPASGRGSG
jgi:hypothetical protein